MGRAGMSAPIEFEAAILGVKLRPTGTPGATEVATTASERHPAGQTRSRSAVHVVRCTTMSVQKSTEPA
jgi:hypothetical protein